LSVAGAFAFNVTGTSTIGGGTSGSLSITNATGIKTLTGAVTINSGASLTENIAAQLAFGSDVTITGTLTEFGAAVVGIAGSLANNGTYTASTGVHTFSGATKTISGSSVNTIPSATFTGNYTNSGTLTSSTALTVTGGGVVLTNNGTINATTSLAGTGGLTNGATGTLNIGGTSTITTFTANAVGNLVNYTGTGQTLRVIAYHHLTLSGGAETFGAITTIGGNLTLSNTATATTAAGLAISGNLSVGDGTTLTIPGFTLGVTGTTTVGGGTSGIISINNATGTKTFSGAVTINAGAALTETAAAQLAFGSDVTITGTLTENTTAVVDIAGSLTNNGTYTAGSGVHTFSGTTKTIGGLTANSIASTAVTGTYTNNGTLTVGTALTGAGGLTNSATGTLNIGGTSTITTLTANAIGNLVNYTGTGQTLKVTAYHHLTLSGGAETFGAITTVGGNLTLSGSATATTAANLAIGGNLSVGDGTTLTVPAFTLDVTGTTTVGGGTSGTLTISSATGTKTFSGAVTIANGAAFTETAAAQLAFGSDVTITGTLTEFGAAVVGIAGNLTNNGTFTASTSTVSLNGVAQTITGSSTTTFHHLTVANSGAKTLTTLPIVNGILSMEGTATVSTAPTYGVAATLQYNTATARSAGVEWITPFAATGGVIIANTGAITLNGASSFNANVPLTINNGATLTPGANLLTLGGNFTVNGTGTLTSGSGGVTMAGTAVTQNISGFTTTGPITLAKTAGTATFSGNASGNTLTINGSGSTLNLGTGLTHTFTGDLTLSAGTLNGGSSTLNVNATSATAWNGNGNLFTSGTSAVVFGGAAQTLAATATTFYNLNLAGSSTKTFTSATTVSNNLSINSGVVADLGTGLTHPVGNYLYFAGVLKQPGSWGSTASAAINQINLYFAATTGTLNVTNGSGTWLGGTSSDWNTASNWSGSIIPTSSMNVIISSGGIQPVISGSTPANDLTISGPGTFNIQNGATMTLQPGPVLTLASGTTVTTTGTGKFILEPGASYLNNSASTPTLQVQQTFTGSKGWRMMSSPVATNYSAMFASPLVAQGFPDSSFPTLQPNLLLWDETDGGSTLQAWRKPTALSNSIPAGLGHFFYNFNGAGRLNLDGSSSGFNYSDVLPITLSATGAENSMTGGSFNYTITKTPRTTGAAPVTTDVVAYAANEGWNLIGNPTASTIDWDSGGAWTKTNVDNTIYIWDPSANDYLTWNGTTGTLGNGRIAPCQALWVKANAASPALSFTNAAKTSTAATFLKSADINGAVSVPMTLQLNGMKTTSFINLSDQGMVGVDPWDAYRLEPMSNTWLALYMNSSSSDNLPLVINNLPLNVTKEMRIPVYVDAMQNSAHVGGSFTLQWNIPANWPSGLTITLLDHNNQTAISMLNQHEYKFNMSANKNAKPASYNPLQMPDHIVTPTGNSTGLKSSQLQPFTIIIKLGDTSAIPVYEDNKPMLLPPAPNPFGQSTVVSFRLPDAAPVRLDLFDLSGRLIETIASGNYNAGLTELDWQPQNLVPGIYLIRMTSGKTVLTVKGIKIKN